MDLGLAATETEIAALAGDVTIHLLGEGLWISPALDDKVAALAERLGHVLDPRTQPKASPKGGGFMAKIGALFLPRSAR